MTDRMVPDGFMGNYWGPAATRDREEGKMPPVGITPAHGPLGQLGPAGPPGWRHRLPARRCARACTGISR